MAHARIAKGLAPSAGMRFNRPMSQRAANNNSNNNAVPSRVDD
jgi:hypothetical protein